MSAEWGASLHQSPEMGSRYVSLGQKEFKLLQEFIEDLLGIHMTHNKKQLLESRLQRRLKDLQLKDFAAYCKYLLSPEGQLQELPRFVDEVTTNKTEFFREKDHFDYLVQELLPQRIKKAGGGKLRVWSAACSTGEEPYSLVMALEHYKRQHPRPHFQFQVVASDISKAALHCAKRAIYPRNQETPIPLEFRKAFLLKSKGDGQYIRMAPEIRSLVQFISFNLIKDALGFSEPFDFIFLRNVLIYFDRATQTKVVKRMLAMLKPEGYLFLGHSESMQGSSLPLQPVHPACYQKLGP